MNKVQSILFILTSICILFYIIKFRMTKKIMKSIDDSYSGNINNFRDFFLIIRAIRKSKNLSRMDRFFLIRFIAIIIFIEVNVILLIFLAIYFN